MPNDLLLALPHRGSTDTSEAVRRHLNAVQVNADLISEGIVTLMADS